MYRGCQRNWISITFPSLEVELELLQKWFFLLLQIKYLTKPFIVYVFYVKNATVFVTIVVYIIDSRVEQKV